MHSKYSQLLNKVAAKLLVETLIICETHTPRSRLLMRKKLPRSQKKDKFRRRGIYLKLALEGTYIKTI